MPKDSNETENIDDLLAELKNETVEESPIPKKISKDKQNTDSHVYEYVEKADEDDTNW